MTKHLLVTLFAVAFAAGLSAQITSVGLIGPATPGGWDVDTNMTQVDDSTWTLTLVLLTEEVKFRANDDWAINWGEDSFPLGTGTQDGDNILIPFEGEYEVTLNSNSGEYYFKAVSPIGVIGSALPFGWDEDINMSQDTGNVNMFWTELDLVAGEAKFRQDDDWAVNWGSSDFPSGVGTQDGDNVPIPNAGNYTISFDTATGEYLFKENVSFDSVAIFGDATPGGWDTETGLTRNANSPDLWEISIRLEDGGLQFSGNAGAVIWGASDFPSGTAVADGDTLQVPAGLYEIDFNSRTGEYTFDVVTIYGTIGIIGDATPGGWDADTDMTRSESDSSEWTLRVELLDGEAKFRAENDWEFNWGAGDFPSGTAEINGANIPVTAGEYNVSFNSFTGAYNFQEIFIYDTIGLIGSGTSFGDWDNDVLMTKDEADENIWYLTSTTLVDGEVKFREGQAWDINWGAASWPAGTGTQDGDNIPSVAGTYGVTLNSASGEYMFGDEISSTQEIIKPSAILAFPNPTSDVLNVDVSAVDMQGEVQLNVFDMSGRLVKSKTTFANQVMQINVNDLQDGHYLLQITNEQYIIGKRFAIAGK